jgi:hypothetical protein
MRKELLLVWCFSLAAADLDGVNGMDALWGGFRIDFDAMRLELD